MKIAIIQFPGSNCERETSLAVQRAGMEALPFLWNEDVTKLRTCDGYIIVGGFSYEDRGRAGIIASLDPVMQSIAQESTTGKPVLGICNGAQILVESGLVPGTTNKQLVMALAANKRIKNKHILGTGYYNDHVYVTNPKPQPQNAFLRNLSPNQTMCIPIAHGEGRFILAEGLWDKILTENIGFLQYCDASGAIKNEFPTNPNGSQHNLAALCNAAGNVMAIMPHPERTAAGDAIFSSMRDYIAENNYHAIPALAYSIPETQLTPYVLPKNNCELIVELIINDNTAISIQKTLHNLGFDKTQVKRYTHWEINFAENATADEVAKAKRDIDESCELFNPNKEIISAANINLGFAILVQDKENIVGQHKLEILSETFGIKNICNIKYGNLWCISDVKPTEIQQFILHKHLLFNPYSQNGFWYDLCVE
jgi:phosphoribosylformylglycinamidine synthase subunit PurQ / glutaminase